MLAAASLSLAAFYKNHIITRRNVDSLPKCSSNEINVFARLIYLQSTTSYTFTRPKFYNLIFYP